MSRVINQSPFVSEETRARIDAIIQRVGFTPDPQARGLAFRRSFLIGLIYDNPNAQYVINIQDGALDALRGSGFELVVHPCDRHSDDFITGMRRFIERQKLRWRDPAAAGLRKFQRSRTCCASWIARTSA